MVEFLAYAAAYAAEATGLSYAAAQFAVTFAVSYVAGRIFSVDSNSNQPVDNGVRQQVPPATTNSIPVVYGNAYLGGTFVDAVLSVDQKCMYYVLAISSISPNGQFSFDNTKMYYGDRLITFDTTDTAKVVSLTDGAGNVDTKISGQLYIGFYTSTDAGTITNVNWYSPSTVISTTSPGGSPVASANAWTGTRQMNGLAFAIVKLFYSQEAGTTQLQPITFHVNHALNGTGVAKPGDVWADYISNETYGGGMAAALIDTASATALNAYSDATITYTPSTGGSATQPRYRINGVLDTGQNVLSNIDRIMSACDSWNQYNAANGKWAVVINRDASTTFAFDDSNVIGEIKTSLTDISNSINQVEASFPNELNRDQRDVAYLETPSGLLYPNEPINKYSCSLDLVNNSVQAIYLANRMLEQAREDLLVTISAAYPAIQVDAGDVVTLTNVAYGWSNKLFRVMKVSEISLPDGNLGASLDLNEYNAAVYADASITAFSPTPNSNLASVQFFSSLGAPTVSASRPAATVPTFDIQVTTPAVGRVTGINLFYTTSASPTTGDWVFFDKFIAPTSAGIANSTNFNFLNESLPAGTYYFGVVVFNEIGQSQISGASASLVWIPTGTAGSQTAQVYLYQWAATTPSGPTGTSTYTWATATNSGYTGGGGWSVTIPANPGTAGYNLYQAGQGITAYASTATTTVSWTGASIASISQNGAAGTPGAPGTDGTKSITVTAFRWSNSGAGSYAQAFNYTWSTGAISAYPSGWTSAASTSPGSGYTLYMISLVITDTATATSTSTNWSGASTGSIGYTQTGGIGPQGDSARIAYCSSTIASPSGTTTSTGSSSLPATGSFGLTGSVFSTSPPSLSTGEYLYQTDGIYVISTDTISWSTPYLSNLKVGSLSAISANLGVVNIATAGNLNSGKTSFSDTTAGFFLGNDSGTPRLSIGSGSTSFTWNGSALAVTGGSFTSGVLQTSTSGARIVISNSNNSINIYNASGLAATLYGSASDGVISSAAAGSVAAILGIQTGTFPAIYGYTVGTSSSQIGIYGFSYGNGVRGVSTDSAEGVYGIANVAGGGNHGVRGQNINGAGSGLTTSGLVGASNGYDFYADGAGTNYGPFTGAHDGLLPVGQTVEIGDIVVDVKCVVRKNISNTLFEVAKSTQPQQIGAIGVLAVNNGLLSNSKPSAFIDRTDVEEITNPEHPEQPPQYVITQVMCSEYDLVKDNYNWININAVGEGQVNVCGENGNIAVGDYICSSSTAGKGMKQTATTIASYTVARAREAVVFDSPTQVQLVACIYLSG